MNTVFLDIETQHLFDEFPGGQKDRTNYGKLKLALAGTLYIDEAGNPCYREFEEDSVKTLMLYLARFDWVVGHNLFNFDYRVLASYFQFPEAVLGTRRGGIISRTFDTMQEFSHIVNENGDPRKKAGWVRLDDIAVRNFDMAKPHDGKLIPKMWLDGKHDEVISYLHNDLDMTKRFYLAGKAGTTIKYDHKTWNEKTNTQVSQGEKEIFLKW